MATSILKMPERPQQASYVEELKKKDNLTNLDKKLIKEAKQTEYWDKIYQSSVEGDNKKAFKMALQADDLNLVRLMLQSGPRAIHEVSDETSKLILKRVNKINRSDFLGNMTLDWIEDAQKSKLIQKMSRAEQNEYLDTLYQLQHENMASDKIH